VGACAPRPSAQFSVHGRAAKSRIVSGDGGGKMRTAPHTYIAQAISKDARIYKERRSLGIHDTGPRYA
jgi:hypothetical protein